MTLNKDYRTFLYEKIFLFFNELRKSFSNKSPREGPNDFIQPSMSSTTINFSQKSDYVDAEILSIMHILHSIKTDRAVARDLVKLLKVSIYDYLLQLTFCFFILKLKLTKNVKEIFYPFTFALALALVKIMPKQDGILDILRNAIEKIFEAELKAKKYSWVFKSLNEDEKHFSKTLLKPSNCK